MFFFLQSHSERDFAHAKAQTDLYDRVFYDAFNLDFKNFNIIQLYILKFYLWLFFFHLHLFDGIFFQYSQVFVSFLFSKYSDFSLMGCLPLLIISITHFSIPNYILISWLYILTAKIRVSYFFFIFSLISSIYIWCLTFSCDYYYFTLLRVFFFPPVLSGDFPLGF